EVLHRSSVQIWSANPVGPFSANSSYDFSSSPNTAYKKPNANIDPLRQVDGSRWAMYAGDVNQDENISLPDFPSLDYGINNGVFGYYVADLNGDGNTDLLDFPVMDANINMGVFAQHP